MNRTHHVQYDLVGGEAPVHPPIHLAGGDGAGVLFSVIGFAVGFFQPALELKAPRPAFELVCRHVGDGADAEEGVRGASGGAAVRCLQGSVALLFQAVYRGAYGAICVAYGHLFLQARGLTGVGLNEAKAV